jgi:rhomboid protease GluP
MSPNEARTIVCPSCGRLTRADAAACFVCGRPRPGLWGLTTLFRRLFRGAGVTDAITVTCLALYLASLVFDPSAVLRPRGMFGLFAPSSEALWALGATGAIPWHLGRWWTVVTAIYLHGGVLHILFNVLWIRQLCPAVEQLYGPARLLVIFTAAGALGFVVSNAVAVPLTVGASGATFGLLGALVAFGQKRGGLFGRLVLREYGVWAVILFVYGLLPGTGVNNWAHAGGFAGGFAAGWLLGLAERQAESTVDHLLAGASIVLTLVAFSLALWAALV